MKIRFFIILLIILAASGSMSAQKKMNATKNEVIRFIDSQENRLIEISDQIWSFAETALEESKSSLLLSDEAAKQGFSIQKGVAGMPTAFVASYGTGIPVIGILGEFDALPGLSQKADPIKQPLEEGKPGHGCGHNLFGTASLGAAIAIKKLIEDGKLSGTIRFYGTPAEETIGGKIYMARAGLFDDLDICLDWHPSAEIEADAQSSQAMIDFRVRFTGKAAHAAADPWNGVSAVDALELYTTGINYLREHVKPTVRIHYLIEKAGDVVNVVPENAMIWTRVRDRDREGMNLVYERIKKIAEGAALMTDAGYSIQLISGWHEVLVNRTGAGVMQKNLELLGPIEYSEEEINFAKAIQTATNKQTVGLNGSIHALKETREDPPGGSTDVGDVSWIVPEVRLSVTTAPKDTPWHSWAVVACGGMSIGHKGMVYATKALALTMIDLYQDEKLRDKIKKEFLKRKGDYVYQAILPEGPPPIPAAVLLPE
jgi:aminobenzoyl-glutamate utilization protein B